MYKTKQNKKQKQKKAQEGNALERGKEEIEVGFP
jgi:hypothetical protein